MPVERTSGWNYALRELHYEKMMMRAQVVERPFFLSTTAAAPRRREILMRKF